MKNISAIILFFIVIFGVSDASHLAFGRVKRFIDEQRHHFKPTDFKYLKQKQECVRDEEAAENLVKVFNATPPTTDSGYICVSKCVNENNSLNAASGDIENITAELHKWLSTFSDCIEQCPKKTQIVKIVEEAIPFFLKATDSGKEFLKSISHLEQCAAVIKQKKTRKNELKNVLLMAKIALAETPEEICNYTQEGLKETEGDFCGWPEMQKAFLRVAMACYAVITDGRILDTCPSIFEFEKSK